MRIVILAGSLVVCCGAVFGQTADDGLTFEVASVKKAFNGMTVPGGGYRPEMRGGPGTEDPGWIRYVNVP